MICEEKSWFIISSSKSAYQTYLKYGFYKKSLRKDAPLTSWTLISSDFFQISTDLEKKGEKYVFSHVCCLVVWLLSRTHCSNLSRSYMIGSIVLESVRLYFIISDKKLSLASKNTFVDFGNFHSHWLGYWIVGSAFAGLKKLWTKKKYI